MSLGTQGKGKENLKLSTCNVFLKVDSKDFVQNSCSDTVEIIKNGVQGMNS